MSTSEISLPALPAQPERVHGPQLLGMWRLAGIGTWEAGVLENYDMYQTARRTIKREGLIGKDGKRHPAYDILVNSYRNFLAGLRYLNLDVSPEDLLPKDDA